MTKTIYIALLVIFTCINMFYRSYEKADIKTNNPTFKYYESHKKTDTKTDDLVFKYYDKNGLNLNEGFFSKNRFNIKN